MYAIEVVGLGREFATGRGIKKRGTPVTALDGVDLAVEAGEVHGLLGPNGAGKTTLCKVLATVLLPTVGTARVLGHDVVTDTLAVRRSIGIVFGGERGLYTRLTARQNLRFWGSMYELTGAEVRERSEQVLDRMGLAAVADQPVETYSRGMKQRLHLARGLVSDPQVVILDEPTTGMDPVAAREFRQLVVELRDEGRTVLLATHDMAEAEELCQRVTLIDGGRILATEQPATLARWLTSFERVEVHGAPDEALAEVASIAGVTGVVALPGAVRAHQIETDTEGTAARVAMTLLAAEVGQVSVSVASLEEVYLHLIGNRGFEVRR